MVLNVNKHQSKQGYCKALLSVNFYCYLKQSTDGYKIYSYVDDLFFALYISHLWITFVMWIRCESGEHDTSRLLGNPTRNTLIMPYCHVNVRHALLKNSRALPLAYHWDNFTGQTTKEFQFHSWIADQLTQKNTYNFTRSSLIHNNWHTVDYNDTLHGSKDTCLTVLTYISSQSNKILLVWSLTTFAKANA